MKKKFKEKAAPEKPFRLVTIPAHKVRGFDGMSMYEDGMQGKLTYASEAYIESQYRYDIDMPEQTIRFTGWENIPSVMKPETREALRQALEAQDRVAQLARDEIERTHVVVYKPLTLKRA